MREIIVHLRLSPKERDALGKLADHEGTTLAEAARLAVRDAAIRLGERERL